MAKEGLPFVLIPALIVMLLAFFGVIMIFVPRIDLSIVLLICLALMVYDLWTQLGLRRR